MSRIIPHPDFIDAYLKHKLSEGERLTFERQLAQDPLLQNEVNLQREIVGSLAEVRKAELKARLNDIPVDGMVPWYGLGSVKWAAAVITAVTLSVASYLYFTSEEDAPLQPTVNHLEKALPLEKKAKLDKPAAVEDLVSEAQTLDAPVEVNPKASEQANKRAIRPDKKEVNAEEDARIAEEEALKLSQIVRPDVRADFDDDFQTKTYDEIMSPEKGLDQVNEVTAPNIEIQNEEAAGEGFHYRYVDNRLYLYGDFKGIPYEILALNTSERIRLFLKYDTSFYLINPSQTEMAPLEVIENQALINELKIVSNFK